MVVSTTESLVTLVGTLAFAFLSYRQFARTLKLASWYDVNYHSRLKCSFYLAYLASSHDLGISLASGIVNRRFDLEPLFWLAVLTLCIWSAWTALCEHELQPIGCVVVIGSALEVVMACFFTRQLSFICLFVLEASAAIVSIVHSHDRLMERHSIFAGIGLFVASAASLTSPSLRLAKCATVPLRLFLYYVVTGHYIPHPQRHYI